MFTGLVEGVGEVREVARAGEGLILKIAHSLSDPVIPIGESVAVSGACLTVVETGDGWFKADLSPETVKRTTLGSARPGTKVNLERALALGERLHGHLVTGHVDTVGRVAGIERQGEFTLYGFEVPKEYLRYVAVKGSIAVDGISLTVADLKGRVISVAVIPHTAAVTTLGERSVGDPVNIEVDLVARYLESLLKHYDPEKRTVEATLRAALW